MSEPFLGQIMMFGGNFVIRGWAKCDGQLLPISQNTALFSLLGTIYGGDGRNTLGLPDFRGRMPINWGQGPGQPNYFIGAKSGATTHTLNVNEMPSHTHSATANATSDEGNSSDPAGNIWAAAEDPVAPYSNTNGASMGAGAITVAPQGGNQPFNIQNPYLAVTFLIALTGVFPSRN